MDEKIKNRLILEKSKALNIPYENLLLGVAREWVLAKLSFKPDKYKIYVLRSETLGLDSYKVDRNDNLYIVIQCSSAEFDIDGFVFNFFEHKAEEITYAKTENGLVLDIPVEFDMIKIKVKLNISFSIDNKINAEEKRLRLSFMNNETIQYHSYSPERELADADEKISNKLDFLTDIDTLLMIYKYANKNIISGRSLYLYLRKKVESGQLNVADSHLESVKAALSSKPIEQRFKGYLRRTRTKEPTMIEVCDVIEKMYMPIIKAINADEVFLEDWMPEIHRYL